MPEEQQSNGPKPPIDVTRLDPNSISTRSAGPVSAKAAAKAANLEAKPYDPAIDRETTRGTIAQALVWTLVAVIGAVVVAGLLTVYYCHNEKACAADTVEIKTLRAVVEIVMTPLIGLVGAVTGFYFGEKSAAGKSGT
jgi:hypothetical protein